MSKKYKNYPLEYQIRDLREEIKVLRSSLTKQNNRANDLQYTDLLNIAIKTFNWDNLPDEIKRYKRMIEITLCQQGKIAFFKHDTLGYYMLPFSYVGSVDDYGQYTRIKPISKNSNTIFDEYTIGEDCVIIRDNELEIPPVLYVSFYADKIAELYRTREKNNNFLKLPFIVGGSGSRGEDRKNAFELSNILQSDKNEIAFITSVFDNLKLFDLKPQYFGRELAEQIKDLRNDYFEYLGTKYLPQDKKERMTQDEVNINEERCKIHLAKRYEPRLTACNEINNMFNLNITVEPTKFDADIVNTTNVVASVAGGVHNDNTRQQQKSDRR